MIPASSLLRSHAIQLNDKELNEESNFPAIVKFLSEKVLSRENDRIKDRVLAEIRAAAEHLTLSVGSELSSLTDPEARERLTADLERRKEEAQDALAADRAVAAGAQRRHRRSHRRYRPRPAEPVPRHHPAHREGDRLRATRRCTGRRSERSWRTRWPPPSGTISSGPTSAPRRLRRRWRALSSKPVWTRSRCPSSVPVTWAPDSASSNPWRAWRPSRSARATGWSPACADRSAAC